MTSRARTVKPWLTLALLLGLWAALPACATTTEQVNLTSDGLWQGETTDAGMSADGRFVAFLACAPGRDPLHTPLHVYLRDRVRGTTQCVSVRPSDPQWKLGAADPAVSADGRFIAFSSWATNLVAGDTNGRWDVFVYDRETTAVERVSVTSLGQQVNGDSWDPHLSADGRFVAFLSDASGLVRHDFNGTCDVFVHDRETGITECVSVGRRGPGNGASAYPTIIGRHQPHSRQRERPGNGASAYPTIIGRRQPHSRQRERPGNGSSAYPTISGDGRFVGFQSMASDLVDFDTNGAPDAFVRDRQLRTTERVSVGAAGEEANDGSFGAVLSGDGRFAVFASDASNLVPGDKAGQRDIFVRDRQAGTIERITLGLDGQEANHGSDLPTVSQNGRFVGYSSFATNLVDWPDRPFNWYLNAFLYDRLTGGTECIGLSSTDEFGDRDSVAAAVSANGRYVLFRSNSFNIGSPAGEAGLWNLFMRDRWFTDVPYGYWASAAISACAKAGIVRGFDDGTYRPSLAVSRDQMAAYISRALAGGDENVPPDSAYPVPSLTDVLAGQWAYSYIEYAAANNVVKGYEDGSYGPALPVTRDQMAVYIARSIVDPTGEEGLAGYTPPTTATFPDVAPGSWAYKQIEYCVQEGVVRGYEDGRYHPEIVVTRDQMAVYVANAFELAM